MEEKDVEQKIDEHLERVRKVRLSFIPALRFYINDLLVFVVYLPNTVLVEHVSAIDMIMAIHSAHVFDGTGLIIHSYVPSMDLVPWMPRYWAPLRHFVRQTSSIVERVYARQTIFRTFRCRFQ